MSWGCYTKVKLFSARDVSMRVQTKTTTNPQVSMKSPIKLTVAALALGLAIPSSRAQDTGTPPPPPPPAGEHGGDHKGPRGDRFKMLCEKLGLTEDQKAKLKPILEDERKAMGALREDNSLDRPTRRAKMQEIRKAHGEQIRALLTPDQQKTFDELRKEHSHGPGGPSGPEAPEAPKQ